MDINSQEPLVVGLGELLWDMLPSGKQLGGAPANFAYHSQALGCRSAVISCVGDDLLGEHACDYLREKGLDTSYIGVDEAHQTGKVTVELDQDGVPDYTIHEEVAWDFIPSTKGLLRLAKDTDAVCYGSLCQRSEESRDTIMEFLQATRNDCLRICDINLRQNYFNAETINRLLESANILKLNDDELPIVADLLNIKGNEDELLAQLGEKYHLDLIALTRGAEGSRLWTIGQDSEHPGIITKIVDTVGAGDSFTAALAVGLLRQAPLEETHVHANQIASFVCTCNGAMPELPADLIEAD